MEENGMFTGWRTQEDELGSVTLHQPTLRVWEEDFRSLPYRAKTLINGPFDDGDLELNREAVLMATLDESLEISFGTDGQEAYRIWRIDLKFFLSVAGHDGQKTVSLRYSQSTTRVPPGEVWYPAFSDLRLVEIEILKPNETHKLAKEGVWYAS